MAAEAERIRAKQTKMLVRCQAAREQRRRREMFEAQEAVVEAERQREAADEALLQGAQDRIRELRDYYDSLSKRKGMIGEGIQALRDKEQKLAKQQQQRDAELKTAISAVSSARMQAMQAAKALSVEAMKTRKREGLADRAFKTFREVEAAAEEATVEEELQDRVTALTGQAA